MTEPEQTNLAADRLRHDFRKFEDFAEDFEEAIATARQQGREEAVREIRSEVLEYEHGYLWTWDADKWTDEDMEHAEQMAGDFMGILDAIAGDGGDRP